MALIPPDLIVRYSPDRHGDEQCQHFVNKCPCDRRFKANEVACPNCGRERQRCRNKVLEGSTACRAHTRRTVLSIYKFASAKLSEAAIEELMEAEDVSLDAEFAMGKLLIASIMEGDLPDRAKLKALKDLFDLARTKQNIDSGGEDLNIKWDDKTALAIRKRFKLLITAIREALELHLPDDPDKRAKIMEHVKQTSKLVGRHKPVKHQALGPRTAVRREEP